MFFFLGGEGGFCFVLFCFCCWFVCLFFLFFVLFNNSISSSICKLPIHSEIYNCTFKNTNQVSIIIIIAVFIRTTGHTSRSVHPGSGKIAMIKYHIFAWTTPGIIVVTSYVLDTLGVIYIGYGKFLLIINCIKKIIKK